MLEQKVTPTVLMLDKSGSYSFDARIKIVTEMYCSHQYPGMYWSRNTYRLVQKKILTEMYWCRSTYRLTQKKVNAHNA